MVVVAVVAAVAAVVVVVVVAAVVSEPNPCGAVPNGLCSRGEQER